MSNDPPDFLPPAPVNTECAFRLSGAAAVRSDDGSWEARWGAPDGRGGQRQKTKAGFATEEQALAHARKLELIERLNRC